MISFLILFIGFIVYRIWQENSNKKICLKNDPFPISVFNFHKQVCATGSANGCPLVKLLSNAFVSFTSCLDLDLYHVVLCRQY